MTSRTQATVKEWTEQGGRAYLDDGTLVDLPADALRPGPFRMLRSGQRVAVVQESGTVVGIELP